MFMNSSNWLKWNVVIKRCVLKRLEMTSVSSVSEEQDKLPFSTQSYKAIN